MNSVEPGSLLLGMGSQSQQGAPTLSDEQILQLAASSAPQQQTAQAPATSNATAAQTAYENAQSKGSTLHVGIGPWLRTDTHIPIPRALDQGLVGAGGHVLRDLGLLRDPTAQAVASQADTTTAGKVGGLLGDTGLATAATLPLGSALGAAGLGRLAANPLAMSALEGTAQGALTSPGNRAQGAVIGGISNPILGAIGRGAGKLVQGVNRTPAAQTLVDQGVQLPLGMMSPSGSVNKVEQALTHLPIIGSKIANARAAVPTQVTERMVQDAAAPGASLPKGLGINDAVSELKGGFENAYQSVLGTPGSGFPTKAVIMRANGADIPLSDALDSVASKARGGLTAPQRAQLGQTLQDHLDATLQGAQQSGRTLEATDLQGLRSVFRDAGRDVSPIDNASRAQRDFWNEAESKVTAALKSQLPPKVASQLDAIDSQYGKFATVRKLAVNVKDREPTMADWSTVIKQQTPPNVYAAGGGWNRDLIQAAAQTVKPTVAHTGALGAGTIAPLVGGLEAALHPGAILAHPIAAGGTLGALGGLYGAYTQPGMRLLAGQTGGQKALQGLLGNIPAGARRSLSLALKSGLLAGGLEGSGLLEAPAQ